MSKKLATSPTIRISSRCTKEAFCGNKKIYSESKFRSLSNSNNIKGKKTHQATVFRLFPSRMVENPAQF